MVVVHEGGHGADLDGVRVVGRVLKEAVVRVEQLSGHQEEELSGGPAVVQPADDTHTHTSSCCSASDFTTVKVNKSIYVLLIVNNREDDQYIRMYIRFVILFQGHITHLLLFRS